MNRQSLEFALNHIKPSNWKIFEEFASEFLISEFPNLRTVASGSGDKGRDAELFSPIDDTSIMLQYSVTTDWADKISKTSQRIKKEFPDTLLLIYATNQSIGAKADNLKKELRKKHRLMLDIRDCEWFLERRNLTLQAQNASTSLVDAIATPIETSREIVKGKYLGLNEVESRAALVYLSLQWEDDTREKGLTKLCFEALVRSVLRETDSNNRLSRDDVRRRVRRILHTHPAERVDQYTDSALNRLTKKYIRHWKKPDEFCLAHEESVRLRDRLAQLEHHDRELREDLVKIVTQAAKAKRKRLHEAQIEGASERLRRILERILLSRGELFVNSIRTGDLELPEENLYELVIQDLGENPDTSKIGKDLVPITTLGLAEILSNPQASSQQYLRSLSDSYTLMAFLQETPDVQSVVTKMFSSASIWLDANVLLPIFAEDLLPQSSRKFQNLLRAARELGLKMHLTFGVLEELERHMNRCLTYMRSQGVWEGPIPFLVSMYYAASRAPAGFGSWIENFRGEKRPEDDIAEYLEGEFGITVVNLDTEAAPKDLRISVQEVFYSAKEKKDRLDRGAVDPIALSRLVAHDVENYVGVIVRRKQEKSNPFGYSAWWLTLDRTAFSVESKLREKIHDKPPASPVMSPDFLVNYLAFGPQRGRISKVTEAKLPLSLGMSAVDFIPSELLELAEDVRESMRNLPERVVQRQVRDGFDAAKSRRGPLAYGGLSQVEDELLTALSGKKHMRPRKSRGNRRKGKASAKL